MSGANNVMIGNRLAVVRCMGRVRSKVGRSYYNLMSITFVDNGERHSMGAAEFARWSTRLERQATASPSRDGGASNAN